MKKIPIVVILLIVFTIASFSQQRLMIVEHFTGASCNPCAIQNPGLEELLSLNTDKVVLLAHQCDIPGYDPMFEDYPEGPNSRRAYYGINSAPQTVLDGNVLGPIMPMDLTQEDLDVRFAVNSPFNIDLSFDKTDEQIDVTMIITSVDNASGNLVARIAVIENEIAFDDNPGSNREKDFIKVLKQFLPSPGGTEIANSWTPGESATINESWSFENVYDINEIAVIAYIQDEDTKEIIQSAFAKTEILFDLDAKLSKLHEIPELMCPGNPEDLTPRVVVTNYGSTPITSFNVEVTINNNAPEVINWSGTLNHLDPAIIHFPQLSYGQLFEENDISAKVVEINGFNNDDNPANDEDIEAFNASMTLSTSFQIRFRSGGLGEDFIWRIVCDGDTQVPAEYVNYTGGYNGEDTNLIDIFLTEDCWRFILKNSGSGGNEDDFFFEIIDQDEVQYRTETVGYYIHIPYFVSPYVSIPSIISVDKNIIIYPNPSNGVINLTNAKTADVYFYNLQGLLMLTRKDIKPNGIINLSDLSKGSYLLKIIQENKLSTDIIILN